MPLSPDDVVEADLVMFAQFNALEVLPLWRRQLPTEIRKIRILEDSEPERDHELSLHNSSKKVY